MGCVMFPPHISSRPPQVRVRNLHSIKPPHLQSKIRAVKPKSGFFLSGLWTLFCVANSSVLRCLICGSCSSARNFASGFRGLKVRHITTSRWTPLPLANTSYCQVCSGLSPPSYCPCWAHDMIVGYPPSNPVGYDSACAPSNPTGPAWASKQPDTDNGNGGDGGGDNGGIGGRGGGSNVSEGDVTGVIVDGW